MKIVKTIMAGRGTYSLMWDSNHDRGLLCLRFTSSDLEMRAEQDTRKNLCRMIPVSNPSHSGLIRGPFERFVDWRQCAAVM